MKRSLRRSITSAWALNILQRDALRDHISDAVHLDMRDLLRKIQTNNGSVVCFQDPSIWLDIGRPDDFVGDRDAFLGDP
jgi:hypothetical protein